MKLNIYIWLIIIELNFVTIRATASAVIKSCIIQIVHHFAHFNPKNAHISQCKSVQICTLVTITVHIYTATLALPFNILVFVSLPSLYLWFTSFSFSRFLSRLTLTDQLSHFIISTLSFQQTNSLANPRRRPKPHRRSIGCLFFFSFLVFWLILGVGQWVFGLIGLLIGLFFLVLCVDLDKLVLLRARHRSLRSTLSFHMAGLNDSVWLCWVCERDDNVWLCWVCERDEC